MRRRPRQLRRPANIDAFECAGLGVHGGIPQLRVVHLAQTLVTLDTLPFGLGEFLSFG